MKILVAGCLVAGILLASCEETATPPASWTTVLQYNGQAVTVSVDDRAGVVEGIARGIADATYRDGLSITNPDGDQTRLNVTWRGNVCAKTDLTLAVTRSEAGLHVSIREPRTLKTCGLEAASIKGVQLKLRTATEAASVVGVLLDP